MNDLPTQFLFDGIKNCDYKTSNIDYIITNLLELKEKYPRLILYKVPRNNKFIIMFRIILTIPLKSKEYPVSLLFYLFNNFPNEPPRVFIHRTANFLINEKNKHINPENFQVRTDSLNHWNKNTRNLSDVVSELEKSFKNNFPVYIPHKGHITHQVKGDCNLFLNENCYVLIFDQKEKNLMQPQARDKSKENQRLSKPKNRTPPKISINREKSVDKPVTDILSQLFDPRKSNKFGDFSEDEVKAILIDELVFTLSSKMLQEMSDYSKEKTKLKGFKDLYVNENNKMLDLIKKKNHIVTEINDLCLRSQQEYVPLKDYIEHFEGKQLDYSNIDRLINVTNSDILRIIATESATDESILICKKAYDKGAMEFEHAMRMIRSLAKEQFKLQFVRDKKLRG